MSETKATASSPFFSILFLILMTLKLTGTIGTSWFWISACLWMPLAATLLFATCVILVLYVKFGEEEAQRRIDAWKAKRGIRD